jgi:transglutaminase-like putative cysteine protease
MARGAAWLGWLLLTHGDEVRRFRQPQPTEERYQRPARRYDLPPYKEGMPYCRSNGRFLRPTRHCDSRAPEVIALAHSLGAYQERDAEFAAAAFEFAKEQVVFEIGPITPVEETLRRGTGSCFDCISVFIALCRCAGIPARYKLFTGDMIQNWRDALIEIDPLM